MMKGIALAHGAYFQNGRFQIACANEADVHRAVLAIGQCASLAMIEIVSHEPVVEDEALSGRVGRTLKLWQPSYVEIHKRLAVEGTIGSSHVFDYVSIPVRERANTVAVKILHPSIGPLVQARLYGFLVLDIKGKEADHWKRLAIVAKSEDWRDSALRLVRDLSNDVILLRSDQEERVESLLPVRMTALTGVEAA
jgi:hypothetical protein